MDPYSEIRCDPHHLVIRCAVDGNRPIAHRAMHRNTLQVTVHCHNKSHNARTGILREGSDSRERE